MGIRMNKTFWGHSLLVCLLAFTGCGFIAQPVAHKRVRRKPSANSEFVSTDSRIREERMPALLEPTDLNTTRDSQVLPARYVLPSFEQRTEQQVAAEALGQIGSRAVPQLVQALKSPEPSVRRQAVDVLMRMGPDAKDAVPELTRLLEDEDEGVRKMASRALGRIGPEAADAVPALMRTLLHEEPATPQIPPAVDNP